MESWSRFIEVAARLAAEERERRRERQVGVPGELGAGGGASSGSAAAWLRRLICESVSVAISWRGSQGAWSSACACIWGHAQSSRVELRNSAVC